MTPKMKSGIFEIEIENVDGEYEWALYGDSQCFYRSWGHGSKSKAQASAKKMLKKMATQMNDLSDKL